jgi:hypothetical protein
MARRGKGERVLGPYPIGKQWRVVLVGTGGERDSRFYPTKEKAEEIIRAVRREFAKNGDKSVTEALDAYERYLLDDKGNKPGSVEDTLYRLGAFFPDGEVLLRDLSTRTCSGYYESLRTRKSRLGKSFSVDSQAFRGEALRASLEGLGQEMGEPDLPGRRGAEGDGARDARAPLDARRRKWRLRSRGSRLTRSRIEQDDDAELREAGGGSGSSAATGDDRPQRRPTRLLI